MKFFYFIFSIFLFCTTNTVAQNNAIQINSNLEVTSFTYPTNFTLEFMMKLDNLNTTVLPNFILDTDGGFTLSFSGNNCIVSQPVFITNEWYRVSITKDTTLKIYINGVLTIQSTNVTPGASDALNFLDGTIDDIRVWNTVLTEAQIQNNMFKHLNGTESNLEFYTDLDIGATDATGNYAINNVGNNVITSLAYANYSSGIWYGSPTAEHIMLLNNNTLNFDITATNVVTETGFISTFNNNTTLQVTDNYFGNFLFKENSGLLQSNTTIVNTAPIISETSGQYSEYRFDYWVSPGNNSVVKNYPSPTSSENQSIIIPNYTKTGTNIEDLFPIGTNVGEHDGGWVFSSHGGIPYAEPFVQNWSVNPTNRELIPSLGFTLKGAIGSNPATASKSFTSIPENGTISVNFSHIQNEDVLVGNPYPSLISLDQFLLHNQNDCMGSIDHWLHWDGNDHITNNYVAGYAIQNRLGTALPHDTFMYNTTNLMPNDNLVPFKSFFTWIQPTGNQIEFTNAMRIPSNTVEDHSTKSRCWISLKKDSGNLQQRDQFLFGATSSTTNNFDYGYDAIHVHDHRPTLIYSFINSDTSTRYKIQSVEPSFTDDIELGVKVNQTGNYIFNIELEENMANADYIYLIDNDTGLYYDLRAGPATVAFSSTGFINNRFLLRFNNLFLSTNEFKESDDFLIWQDAQHIYITNTTETTNFKTLLFTIDGRKILNTTQKHFNKNYLAKGIYIIKIYDIKEQALTIKKILIN